MNNYKVQRFSDASALASYWKSAYGFELKMEEKGEWYELEFPKELIKETSAQLSFWRNINDAFIGGRNSNQST